MSHSKDQDSHQPSDENENGDEHRPSDKTQPMPPQSPIDKTRPTAPYNVSEAGGPIPPLDSGPTATPVDDIQEAIISASQQGDAGEIQFDDLPEPMPEIDEGPRPAPVDDIQAALFEASQQGETTELEFDNLPGPGLPTAPPKKVVKFESKPLPAQTQPSPKKPRPRLKTNEPSAPVPLPDFPEPETERPLIENLIKTDFRLLLTIFVTFRFLTLLLFRPGGFIRDWSDFDTYLGIAALSDYGLFPFLDFWLEWPPLVPWLAVGVYKLSLFLPPWPDDPRLWFILILGFIFLLFEIGNFYLIYRLATRLLQTPATISRVLWLYIGLFPPVYAMLGFFDGVALFFILLSLNFVVTDQRFPSAMTTGIGFLVKIIPGLMLPVALRRLWFDHQKDQREAGTEMGLYTVVFGLTIIILLLPFAIFGQEWVLASARSMSQRASWETIWAVMEGYYGFGVVLGDRLNPNETRFAIHNGSLPWWLITLFFAALYAFLFSRPADYSKPRNVVAFAGLTISIFMLYSKGYSPQFLVYLLPFIVLLFPNGRGLTYALIFTGLNILEQPIYFVMLPNEAWLLIFIVVARFFFTIIMAVEFSLIIWSPEFQSNRVYQKTPLVFGSLSLISLVAVTPFAFSAYMATRLNESPLGTFVEFMEAQAQTTTITQPQLLLSDQTTYREVFPHLNRTFDLQLTNGAQQGYESAPTLGDLTQNRTQVWGLPTGPQAQTLSNGLNSRGTVIDTFFFEGLGTASLYQLQGEADPLIPPARFSGIELLTHQVDVEAGSVELTLYWRAQSAQSQSLTVFTQLLDAEGQQIAGHDSIPRNGTAPTNEWTVDAIQMDFHRIELPVNLPPGDYTIIAGLYNSFGDRLRAIDPSGVGYRNRAVPLETIRLP
ncbi:MAG: hypothetical protein AAF485_01400, partial [Chloroflexota bacterium]